GDGERASSPRLGAVRASWNPFASVSVPAAPSVPGESGAANCRQTVGNLQSREQRTEDRGQKEMARRASARRAISFCPLSSVLCSLDCKLPTVCLQFAAPDSPGTEGAAGTDTEANGFHEARTAPSRGDDARSPSP